MNCQNYWIAACMNKEIYKKKLQPIWVIDRTSIYVICIVPIHNKLIKLTIYIFRNIVCYKACFTFTINIIL